MNLGRLSERATTRVRGGVLVGSAGVVMLLAGACGRLPLGVRQLAADAGSSDSPAPDAGLAAVGSTPGANPASSDAPDASPADAAAPVSEAPSCRAASLCGGSSCCAARSVPGGTFDFGLRASGVTARRATVDPFALDVFEVTVGRFRAFVTDYDRWRADGNPAQPATADALPSDSAALRQALLRCDGSPYSTWDGAGDEAPMNCASWFEASAFCTWDGGRLPSETEWEYAATGGAEQRVYPWGDAPEPQPELALFGCDLDSGCTLGEERAAVGSHAAGAARWGQQDLAGSLAEWLGAAPSAAPNDRAFRGGSWIDEASALRIADHQALPPEIRLFVIGFRCAR